MPTGYTSRIQDGETFEQFIMDCAKAFEACITMRDSPMSEQIPDKFEPSDYHSNRINEIEQQLKDITSMSEDELKIICKNEYEQETSRNQELIDKSNDLQQKYESMLEKVNNWICPSKDHEGLKIFMIQQIKSSIKGDCNADYYKNKKIEMQSANVYLSNKIKELNDSLEYNIKEHDKEIERTNSRNLWIKQLRDSLK